jgi:hypothetical protein
VIDSVDSINEKEKILIKTTSTDELSMKDLWIN